ncbi:integrase family protein [Pseudomonas petrae]|uniref:Integrase family protein n=1 Tax=Pseudomonas petrae TaxID=2912190 RepID=A0ABS9I8T8_9PSED|nr:integrase family protein [Pseudomonas petrae]MCF7532173.1 integrase family protein [Pseudomonas petrae]MCF7537706.1 integrase family protein [Pseudomonas petrae]MCF7543498.1 integrase family protein [Pseudomonas petrae]
MPIKKGTKQNGRSKDIAFSWLTAERGEQWEVWRRLMTEWLATQHQNTHLRITVLNWFSIHYLPQLADAWSPRSLFDADKNNLLPDLTKMLEEIAHPVKVPERQNAIVNFIDWVIEKELSEVDQHGRLQHLVKNPFSRASKAGIRLTETVHNPLPYAYIKELRTLICPNPAGNFTDWTWAQQQYGPQRSDGTSSAAGKGGDWFEVDPAIINHSDPDCVWRERTIVRKFKGKGQREVTVHEIWSPVRAVVILAKLHLPLRTYQVRFLDSGEADTWRYERGKWNPNTAHPFVLGNEQNPWRKGVFCRINSDDTREVMTGLYISTNKTADQNKDERQHGYTIPWQHVEVLYWLEKLRNWQETYNPILKPTPCAMLDVRHFGHSKSEHQKREMGSICFLFRDAAAKEQDRHKPIAPMQISRLWYRLLSALEDRVADLGQTLSDGSRLRFVREYPEDHVGNKLATDFPLHSLRVSLLTCYAMDGQIPISVLSKLLAGHTRLIMTLYYTKPTPAMMSRAMETATSRVEKAEADALSVFLRDADLRQISSSTAWLDESSLRIALTKRNPVSWEHRHIGLCLVGGNTANFDDVGTVSGCWNGGAKVVSKGTGGESHGPVPNGPENCVRCRWLVTDARYLDALRAHFNNISYKVSLAANLAIEHEQSRDALLEARYLAIERGHPFMMQHDLQKAERRFEKQTVLADQYASDLIACFQLIGRVIAIEENRAEGDASTKLIAVGTIQDVSQSINFIETRSEMLQLAQICEDAEVYPDLADELRKSPAIEKRSRGLNHVLMQHGYSPIFMQMDERMQLIAGNAMMRAMAFEASPSDQLKGFSYVTGAAEAGKYLTFLPCGLKALEDVCRCPVVKLSDLTSMSTMHIRELNNG